MNKISTHWPVNIRGNFCIVAILMATTTTHCFSSESNNTANGRNKDLSAIIEAKLTALNLSDYSVQMIRNRAEAMLINMNKISTHWPVNIRGNFCIVAILMATTTTHCFSTVSNHLYTVICLAPEGDSDPYSKTGIDPFWGVGPRPKIPTKKHIIESDSLKALRARFNLRLSLCFYR
jgi:hypothetical protein